MSGTEKAPLALGAGEQYKEENLAAQASIARVYREERKLVHGNFYGNRRLTRRVSTAIVEAQVVQTFAPIDTDEFGDGHGA